MNAIYKFFNPHEEEIFKILRPQAEEIYFTIKELNFSSDNDIDTLIKKCQLIKNLDIHKKTNYTWLTEQVNHLPSSKKELSFIFPSKWQIDIIISRILGRCERILNVTELSSKK